MLTALAINLLAALIGFLIARVYQHFKSLYDRRVIKWFWAPTDSSKISLYCGKWTDRLSDIGEVEPVVNLQDALTLGELRGFLPSYYKDVEIVTEMNSIDWHFPVVSVIASNYGVGNLGIIKHLTSSQKLNQFSRADLNQHFQAVIRSRIAGDDTILDTELYFRSLN